MDMGHTCKSCTALASGMNGKAAACRDARFWSANYIGVAVFGLPSRGKVSHAHKDTEICD